MDNAYQGQLKALFNETPTAKVILKELARRERSCRAPHFELDLSRFRRFLENDYVYKVDKNGFPIPEQWERSTDAKKRQAYKTAKSRTRKSYQINVKHFYDVFRKLQAVQVPTLDAHSAAPKVVNTGRLVIGRGGRPTGFRLLVSLIDIVRGATTLAEFYFRPCALTAKVPASDIPEVKAPKEVAASPIFRKEVRAELPASDQVSVIINGHSVQMSLDSFLTWTRAQSKSA